MKRLNKVNYSNERCPDEYRSRRKGNVKDMGCYFFLEREIRDTRIKSRLCLVHEMNQVESVSVLMLYDLMITVPQHKSKVIYLTESNRRKIKEMRSR